MSKHSTHSLNATKPQPETIEIPLSRGKVAVIDAADAELVLQHKWFAHTSSKRNGRKIWYALTALPGGVQMQLHRFILNVPDGMDCDHRNGDGLDCRRENLRPATRRQNLLNRPQHSRSVGNRPYKGVIPTKTGFVAELFVDHQRIRSVTLPTAQDAAKAYDLIAEAVGGEFARKNFPDHPPNFSVEDVLNPLHKDRLEKAKAAYQSPQVGAA